MKKVKRNSYSGFNSFGIEQQLHKNNELKILDELKFILNKVYEQQVRAETKATIFITLSLALVSYIAKHYLFVDISQYGQIINTLFFLMVVYALCQFYFVFKPKIKNFDHRKQRNNLNEEYNVYNFFMVANGTKEQLKAQFNLQSRNHSNKLDDKLELALVEQIYYNSQIAVLKNKRLIAGINALGLAICIELFAVFIVSIK